MGLIDDGDDGFAVSSVLVDERNDGVFQLFFFFFEFKGVGHLFEELVVGVHGSREADDFLIALGGFFFDMGPQYGLTHTRFPRNDT